MNKETILLLISILSTPFLGALVSTYFSRKKTSAEAHNLNITGEISIGDSWQKYAMQQQKDKEELRQEFTEKINAMKSDHFEEMNLIKEEFSRITSVKNDRIKLLEGRVQELETEVSKYRSMGDHAAAILHTKIDEAKDELMSDITT